MHRKITRVHIHNYFAHCTTCANILRMFVHVLHNMPKHLKKARVYPQKISDGDFCHYVVTDFLQICHGSAIICDRL